MFDTKGPLRNVGEIQRLRQQAYALERRASNITNSRLRAKLYKQARELHNKAETIETWSLVD